MPNYSDRQKIQGVVDDQAQNAFTELLSLVPESWLLKANAHPLRALWKRKDILSTNELFSLGTAIEEVKKIDPSWLRHHAKHLMSAERNNYLGSVTEILGMYLLNNKDHPTLPAKINQAGYDALMAIPQANQNIRFSIKNYGQSKHEQTFMKRAAETEKVVVQLLKKYQYYPVTVTIDSPSLYPSEDKWKLLHKCLDRIFQEKKNATDPFTALATDVLDWIIYIVPIVTSDEKFHPDFKSYTIIISSVLHPNENANLLDKIQSACVNLAKHERIEDQGTKNFLFIRLSPIALVQNCQAWLDSYFAEFPDKPISGIIFQQTSVVTDVNTNTSHINQFFFPYLRLERLEKWLPAGFQFAFKFPVGRVSTIPATYKLNIFYPDGKKVQVSLDNRYIYQRGQHYLKMQSDGKGAMVGNINPQSFGVFTNIILELSNQPGKAVIGPILPPSDELLLL